MAENYSLQKSKKVSGWLYVFLLYLSFVWIAIYPVTNSLISSFVGNYGNLFDFSNPNFDYVIAMVLSYALVDLLVFEVGFYIYRLVLSFKVYSFIVPNDIFKTECRIYYIYRNLILGVFLNICFLFPYLYIFEGVFRILVTMSLLIIFAKHLATDYGETIVGHFVFKNFCYPIFVYESLVFILQILGVM